MLTMVAYLVATCCLLGVVIYCTNKVRRGRQRKENACVVDESAEPTDFEGIPRSLIHPHQCISENRAKKRRRWL